MRVLVTGASGFVGGRLFSQWSGHELIAVARQPLEGCETIVADLADLQTRRLPAHVDAVVHLAQSREYRNFPKGASDMFSVNIASTAALIRWAAEVGAKQFTFASTGSVYEPYDGDMTEDSCVSPANYYPASKSAAESILRPYSDLLNVSVLRLFFVYGPGQRGMLISNLIQGIREGSEFTVPRDNVGLCFVPTYVDDVVSTIAMATVQGWPGVWNVSQRKVVSFMELLDVIGGELGIRPNITVTADPPPSPIVPDLTKLSGQVDLDKFVDIEAGIALTIR